MPSIPRDIGIFGRATSLSKYLALVEQIWVQWSGERNALADIWFRGHPDASWTLQPGINRPPVFGFSEHRLRHDFVLKAQPYVSELSNKPGDDWEWYFLMQHYGVPTRLIDWTESALVALYFALLDAPVRSTDTHDACVWVFQPRALNKYVAKVGDFVPIYSDSSLSRYLPTLWDERKGRLPVQPVAFDPPSNSPRLSAQRGKFTIHGSSKRPLESHQQLARQALRRILIPSASKERLRRQFLLTGVTESVLFPSLSGVAGEIKHNYSKLWEI